MSILRNINAHAARIAAQLESGDRELRDGDDCIVESLMHLQALDGEYDMWDALAVSTDIYDQRHDGTGKIVLSPMQALYTVQVLRAMTAPAEPVALAA